MLKNERFNCHDQEQPSWLDRAERAVGLIRPIAVSAGSPVTIADIGCGDMKLRQLLEAGGLIFDYRGYDLVPQSTDVTQLDISAEVLPQAPDIAIMLGIAEYLGDLGAVFKRLAEQTNILLVSYVVSDYSTYTPHKLHELGWAHHLSRQAFGALLEANSFRIEAFDITANGRTVLWLCRSIGGSELA